MRKIEDIRALLCAVTPGPWFVLGISVGEDMTKETVYAGEVVAVAEGCLVSAGDGCFIAESRTLVPEMLAALEAKDAEIEQWKTADSQAVAAARAETAKLREVLDGAWWQFAYVDGNGKRWCGGLSALEDMADALGLDV